LKEDEHGMNWEKCFRIGRDVSELGEVFKNWERCFGIGRCVSELGDVFQNWESCFRIIPHTCALCDMACGRLYGKSSGTVSVYYRCEQLIWHSVICTESSVDERVQWRFHPRTLQSVDSQTALPLLCMLAAGPCPLLWNTMQEDDSYFVLSKIHTLYAMRAHTGSKAKHSRTTLALESGGVQRHTPAHLSTEQDVGWASGLVWNGTENFVSTGFRTPDLLAHSDLLNRLRRLK
jgi:hypothetical protein